MNQKDKVQVRSKNGRVVSISGDKSVVVLVERDIFHAKYGKSRKSSKKYHAHDENNSFSLGDYVEINACRPISRKKRWVVVKGIDIHSS